ncbi:hypothetical protein WOLCODRAFT_159066 [Wolfiporia cocos MD-104 SS10]|uniref:Uncharacterized protein n=1 Tax=Wolfiporia cocos (strain MD-104) TaxID=742152 RepID=A0A2H3JTQ0_WOLCO|nr:hypothetical protein WOLCODRAFT_159066 [Wolfiporia cocos MD-104 SS10]
MRPDRPCQGSARVSACKRGVSQHLPGRRPCNQPRTGGADRLNNRALGLDDPQLHPAPRAYLQRRTNARGIASTPTPVTRATAQALGRQAGYSPSAHGGTTRLNNWDLQRCSGLTTKHPRLSSRPKGRPCPRTYRARGSLCVATTAAHALGGCWTSESKRAPRRTPPAATRPSRPTVAHQRKAIRQGQPPESYDTAASHSHRPPAYSTHKGGQRRIIAKATRRAPTSNSGAAASPNAPPLLPAASIKARSRHAARQRGQPPPLRRTQAPSRTTNGTGTRRTDYRGPGPRLLDTSHRCHSHSPSGQGVSTPRHATASPVHSDTAHGKAASDAQGPASFRSAGSQRSSATPNPKYPAKRRRHRPSSKGGGQGNKSSEGQNKENNVLTHLWERNAHVGLGQPRTRHHAQSGRSGRLSVTVPLA